MNHQVEDNTFVNWMEKTFLLTNNSWYFHLLCQYLMSLFSVKHTHTHTHTHKTDQFRAQE